MPFDSNPTSRPDAPALRFLISEIPDPPVTVVREIRVRPGAEGRFELLMGALIAEATRQPGHLGATVLRPRTPQADTYRFIYKFDARSNLEAWHTSPLRRELFAPIVELIVSERFEEYPGLETWFDLPAHLVPVKWKATLISWAAIYVLVVALSYALRALKLSFPIPITALILTGIIVPLVAYVVGPLLGRVLRGWLHTGAAQ